jgi:hypothetical protein
MGPHAMTPRRSVPPRGSALLLAVVIIAILSVVVLAVIKLSSNETEAVISKRRYDNAVSCADAARELLQSQFSTYGTSPTEITLDRVVGDARLTTGHFDNVAVKTVAASSASSSGAMGVSDMSNRIARIGLGGQVYRMTVVCENTTNANNIRQSEVEFVVRFGL